MTDTNVTLPPGHVAVPVEVLDEIVTRALKGRDVVAELQSEMDSHYEVIRDHMGVERGPGFAHRINSMLLRTSGHFFQIKEKAATSLAAASGLSGGVSK